MEDEIAEVVREHGWFAANVSDHEPPFLYTIGLMQTYDHPEFIIVGLEGRIAHALLAGIIREIREGQRFAEPGVSKIKTGEDELRIGFRSVHLTQHPRYLGFAMGYLRHVGHPKDLHAMQAFWPDRAGTFPFEAGCDFRVYASQPRLDLPLTPSEVQQDEREWE
jgi:hypothetical protein